MDKKAGKKSEETNKSQRLWNKMLLYLTSPEDPSNLAVLRIMFGILMMIDIPQERGMVSIDQYFTSEVCHFPLIHSLRPLPLDWMHVVYLVMFLGAFGISIGFMYRLSCLLFGIPYWYIFLLEKSRWNNHSYLYGLMSLLLLVCDTNRYWSVDGYFYPKLKNSHVPKWNYILLRFQIFLVYFYAGLKKLDLDWMTGYSMTGLSRKWVFDPFRLFLDDKTIDLLIVHIGGLVFDLTEGFLLVFDKTRLIGILFGVMFHGMNSQMFHIGMFPYAMLATLPLYCSTSWPKKLFSCLPNLWILPTSDKPQTSTNCVYVDSESCKEEDEKEKKEDRLCHKPAFKHKALLLTVLLYVTTQLFLPYSHFITKGYNAWTQGLYGYSWDMMVHSWSTQHLRVKIVDQVTKEVTYIRPKAWLRESRKSRWSSHPDMIKQYVACVAEKIKSFPELNITQPAIYLDVWRSMNQRFQQRMVDPNIDIVSAPWSPFDKPPWIQPLLTELSPWREKLAKINEQLREKSNFSNVVFVADFPGLFLENFISEELNTSLTLLHGKVEVQFNNTNHTVEVGEKIFVPSNDTHLVFTVSQTPSCWMYIFTNMTEWNNETIRNWILHPETSPTKQKRRATWKNTTQVEKFKMFVYEKYFIFTRSFLNVYYSVVHLTFGTEPPEDYEDEAQETGDNEDHDSADNDDTSQAQAPEKSRDEGMGNEPSLRAQDKFKQEL